MSSTVTPPRSTGPEPKALLQAAEKRRLRKIVKVSLTGLILVEAFVLAYAFIPQVRAFTVNVNSTVLQVPIGQINTKLGTTNDLLRDIRDSNDDILGREDQHSQQLSGGAWDPALADVTSGPMGSLHPDFSIADASAASNLEAIIPMDARPWTNYHQEYSTSAQGALATLQTSLTVLNEHYQQIEDDSRLSDIASAASSEESRLAMGELQVQSSLEVARQLHALRAQQALATNLYAIAESHRIGADARTRAKDRETNCEILSNALAGEVVATTLAGVIC
ncbi:MAG: hypothetical protein AAGI52_18890 [Bacteroidota bacterium]